MKTTFIAAAVIAAVVLYGTATRCPAAQEKGDMSAGIADSPNEPGSPNSTDPRILLIKRIEQVNPEKAEMLRKLLKEDPERFREELRKPSNRSDVTRRHTQQGLYGSGGRGKGGSWGHTRMRADNTEEFLQWLEQDYPDDAKKLAEVKQGNKPEIYKRLLALKRSRYGRIFETSKRNPELAKVLKEDLQLQRQRNRLLRQIRSTKDEVKKKELTSRLREVVSRRFDVVVQKKQIEYEQLLKKLEALKERVKKSKAAVDKWTNIKFKEKNVNTRVEKLVSRPEEFDWD